jgi:hypothetical protein
MAELTIGEVCGRWKIARSTVMLALKSGGLSGRRDEKGRWLIEVSEIVRWRGEADRSSDRKNDNENNTVDQSLVVALQDRIQSIEKQLTAKDGQIADQNRQIERLQDTLAATTRLLEHDKRSWWQRVFGRG